MKKIVLKRNSALVAAGPSPAWKTGQESGYFMPLVQNSEVSLSIDRQTSKQVGFQQYAIDDIVRSPDVTFNMTYLFSPYMLNEYLMGISGQEVGASTIADTQSNRDQNFYLIVDNEEGSDLLHQFSQSPPRDNFSGMNCISMGNCFLTNYTVGFQVGSLLTASVSFAASNLKMDHLTGQEITIPAINLASGNSSGAGVLNFTGLKDSFSGYINGIYTTPPNVYNMPVVSPQNVDVILENLQVGGYPLISGALIQSLNISIPFERTSLYGLGSNYVYGRKLQLPLRATVDLSAIVEDFNSGDISQLHIAEETYDLEIKFSDQKRIAEGTFNFQNARLNSLSYSLGIDGNMEFSANYSVEITSSTGLAITSPLSPVEPEPPSGDTYLAFDILAGFVPA
jgi:hypothetical protein